MLHALRLFFPAIPSRRSFLDRVLYLASLHRQRQDLSMLDDALLKDVGISREEAEIEAKRPVWDVPATWRR